MDEQVRHRVLMVGGSPLLRALMSELLRSRGYEVRSCASIDEVTSRLGTGRTDVVVIGLRLAESEQSLRLVETITAEHPGVGVLMLSSIPDIEAALPGTASRIPGAAVLASSEVDSPDVVIDALESVIPPGARPPLRRLGHVPDALRGLSDLQMDLLRRLTAGQSNEQIASERAVSLRAVESLASRTFLALGLHEGPGNPRVRAVTTYLRAMGQM